MRPHRQQPARLLCPWDSPDQNTGVGCHAVLQVIFLTQRSNHPVITFTVLAHLVIVITMCRYYCCSVAQSCLFAAPWLAARQASLSITTSRSLLKLMSIESAIPSNQPFHPLSSPSPAYNLSQRTIFLSVRVFSYESFLCIKWPKY